MDDSGFLRELAQTAREEEAEEQQRWDRWERLNDGALSPEEEAELRALAATSAEDEKAFEAFRPLGSDFRARVVAKIRPPWWRAVFVWLRAVFVGWRAAVLVGWRAGSAWWRAGSVEWRVGFLGSGPAAAAAALILRLWFPAVPEILVEVEPILTLRGEETTFIPGGQFKATVWPAKKISPRVQIEPRCYIETAPPEAVEIHEIDCVVSERLETGGMSIQGSLPGDQSIGSATLWLVLAYSGHQPDREEIGKLNKVEQTRRRYWEAVPKPIEIRAP